MADHDEIDLASSFGDIARTLVAEEDAHATLRRIVRLAVDTIDACQHCGISIVEGRSIGSPAASDAIPTLVDELQSETGEGPCVDAIQDHEVFQTGRLSKEVRWPNFAHRASQESGIESILSFRLFIEKDTMGSLNLYSSHPDAFDQHDVAFGAVFAAHAAVAWSTARVIDNLRKGLQTRELIGEAVGILMARQDCSETKAFDVLKRASQRLNIKLRLVAEGVVHPKDPSTHHEGVIVKSADEPG